MTDELTRLEREIAEESARSDIECEYVRVLDEGDRWYDTNLVSDEDWVPTLERAERYLELRGLLERHPERPELVRFVEKADE